MNRFCLLLVPLLILLFNNIPSVLSKNQWWSTDYNQEDSKYSTSYSSYPSSYAAAQYQTQQSSQSQNQPPPLELPSDTRRRSRNPKAKFRAILAGELCDPADPIYSACTPNAQCDYFEDENVYKCNCTYAYEVTSNRKCLRTYGYYCDNKDPCNHEEFLTCIDNKCQCDNGEIYQISGDICRAKVGGPCSPSGPECVANAVCKTFDHYGRSSRCVCKDGYVETSGGQCALGVGMPCKGKGECHPEIPLVCKEGLCSCRESVHVYDPETNSCVGLVGSQCCHNVDGIDCPNGVTNGCVAGAFCKKTSRALPGRCACQSYNLEGEGRTCLPNPTFGHAVTGKVY